MQIFRFGFEIRDSGLLKIEDSDSRFGFGACKYLESDGDSPNLANLRILRFANLTIRKTLNNSFNILMQFTAIKVKL